MQVFSMDIIVERENTEVAKIIVIVEITKEDIFQWISTSKVQL